jgi:hypothetical protein
MFLPGDVISFHNMDAKGQEKGKWKHHLCISLNGHYLFINSPKDRVYPGDLVVPCSEIPCLNPTPTGESIISCTLVMRKSNADLKGAKKQGSISVDLLRKLVKFIEHNPVLSEEIRDEILEGLGEWL